MTNDATGTGAGTPNGTGAGTVPAPPTGTVTLRRFAELVPMPYSTARDWRDAGRIRTASTTATGRYMVPVEQLPAVRAALGLDPTEGPTP